MREKFFVMERKQMRTRDNIDIDVQGLCSYEIFDPIKGVLNCALDVDVFIQKTAQKLLHEAIESSTLEKIMLQRDLLQLEMKVFLKWQLKFFF